MWFGTLAGLNCYDGYTFKVFTRQEYNQNSLPDNFIESMVEQKVMVAKHLYYVMKNY